MFTYIYQIFGGTDIRRLSIRIKTDPALAVEPTSGPVEDESLASGCELIDSKQGDPSAHEVEVLLRRIQILVTPNQEMFPKFTKGENPFTVYVSRTMPIGVL